MLTPAGSEHRCELPASHKQACDAGKVRITDLRSIMTDNFLQISMEIHN